MTETIKPDGLTISKSDAFTNRQRLKDLGKKFPVSRTDYFLEQNMNLNFDECVEADIKLTEYAIEFSNNNFEVPNTLKDKIRIQETVKRPLI